MKCRQKGGWRSISAAPQTANDCIRKGLRLVKDRTANDIDYSSLTSSRCCSGSGINVIPGCTYIRSFLLPAHQLRLLGTKMKISKSLKQVSSRLKKFLASRCYYNRFLWRTIVLDSDESTDEDASVPGASTSTERSTEPEPSLSS